MILCCGAQHVFSVTRAATSRASVVHCRRRHRRRCRRRGLGLGCEFREGHISDRTEVNQFAQKLRKLAENSDLSARRVTYFKPG